MTTIEMNAIETKISNTSKRISQILKIGEVLMLIVTSLAILAIGILSFANAETKASFTSAFTNNVTTQEITHTQLLLMFIYMVLYAVCMYVVLHNTYMIFKDVSIECTPFKRKHVVRIKRIAYIVIAISILGSIADGLFDLYTTNSMMLNVNFSGIILGLIIYCLALFFDYGCELQEQSDETL